jgi:hypothetical protein
MVMCVYVCSCVCVREYVCVYSDASWGITQGDSLFIRCTYVDMSVYMRMHVSMCMCMLFFFAHVYVYAIYVMCRCFACMCIFLSVCANACVCL